MILTGCNMVFVNEAHVALLAFVFPSTTDRRRLKNNHSSTSDRHRSSRGLADGPWFLKRETQCIPPNSLLESQSLLALSLAPVFSDGQSGFTGRT